MYGCRLLADAAFPDVCSVVRSSRMWSPHDIVRDSWVWGEQEALEMMSSPHEVGDEALTERSPCRKEAGWPLGKMVVVVGGVCVGGCFLFCCSGIHQRQSRGDMMVLDRHPVRIFSESFLY